MSRISRTEVCIEIAEILRKRATCMRGQVGAVITTASGRIISTGYNGPLAGENECSNVCDHTVPCTRAVHAEANAIYAAARAGISVEGCTLYTTTRPCRKCFEAIVQSGIVKVVYLNDYTTEPKVEGALMKEYQRFRIDLVHYFKEQSE